MKKIKILIFITILFNMNISRSQNFIEKRNISYWTNIGKKIFLKSDFDSDGITEFLTDANNKTQLIIGEIIGNKIHAKYKSIVFKNISQIEYVDTDSDGINELYVFDFENEKVYELDVPSLKTINEFSLEVEQYQKFNYIYYGDRNNDGNYLWYALSKYYKSYSLSPSDFSKIDELPEAFQGDYVFFGNFDDDSENEILIKNKNYSLLILNNQTLSIEYEISEFYGDFKIFDSNNDNVNEICILYSNKFTTYDFSKAINNKSISNLSGNFESCYINDIDLDGKVEAILYEKAYENSDIMILEFNPLKISKTIDLPYKSQNYDGEIIAFDNFFGLTQNNLLFAGKNLHLVDINTGKEIANTKEFSNLSVTSYENYTSKQKKQLVISEIENSSGANAIVSQIVDFESANILREITAKDIAPEEYSASIDKEIINFRYKNSLLNDLVFMNRNDINFYQPKSNKIYKRDKLYGEFKIADIDFDGYPEIIKINTSKKELTILTMFNSKIWHQKLKVVTSASNMKVFQMDNDKQLEIVLFNSSKIQILDPITGEMEILNTDFSSWSLKDITIFRTNQNNLYLAGITNERLYIYNVNTQTTILNKKIESYSAKYIDHINMKTDTGNSTYLLTFKGVLNLYDLSGNLMSSSSPQTNQYSNYSPFIFHDNNNDKKPYIIVSYQNQVVEYKIDLPGIFKQFFHITDQYPHNDDIVNVNGSFFIEFSDKTNLDNFSNAVSLFYKKDSSIINFTAKTDNNLKFEIIPDSTLKEGEKVVIRINGELNSENNKKLDIDYDFLQSSKKQFHKITFATSSKINKPKISLLNNNTSILYSNTKRLINVQVDNNQNSHTPIYKLSSGFTCDSLKKSSPIDNSFNESKEVFELYINTFNKESGTYNFKIIASTYDKSADTLLIPIKIIKEEGIPFKRDGVNNLNTFYQKNNKLRSKLKLSWSKQLTNKNTFDKNIVVGEGEYIYFRRGEGIISDLALFLYKVKISTGEIVWKKLIDRKCTSGNPVMDRGYIYIQVNNIQNGTKLKCFEIQNGDLVWESSFRNQHTEPYSPIVTDSLLLMAGGQYGGIYCFDRWTGKEKWFNSLEQSTDWTPSIFNDVVYTSAGGVITAFDIWTGNKLWNTDLKGGSVFINNSPIIDSINNQLFYLTQSDSIVAINLETHNRNWTKRAYYSSGHLGLKGENLFYLNNQKLYKVKSLDGSIIDSTPVNSFKYSDILLSEDLLIFSSNDGTFVIDSEELDKRDENDKKNANISIIDSTLFLITKSYINAYRFGESCYEYKNYEANICFGNNYTIDDFSYSETGIFIDTIINDNGCNEVFTLNLNVGKEVIVSDTLIVPDNGNHSGSIAISAQGGVAPYKYKWSNNKNTTILSNLSSGDYYLTITDSQGCEFKFSFTIPFYNFIKSLNDNNIQIFPNIVPVNRKIRIKGLEENGIYYYAFWDIYGYKSSIIPIINSEIVIDNNQLLGIRFLLIFDKKKNKIYSGKIIIINE